MEFFRITSRFAVGGSEGPAGQLLGPRLQGALMRRAAEVFGPRWRGPFEAESEEPPVPPAGPALYDDLVSGASRVVVLVATPASGAPQAIRAALHRTADPGADFPPVLVTPDAESVHSGALQGSLRELARRAVPIYAVDLLGVAGSAMPDALRVVTEAIAREARASQPARWILLLDPLYERRIGRWSAPEFFGEVRLERAQPIDGVSLRVEVDAAAGEIALALTGALGCLYLGLARAGIAGEGAERIVADMARVQGALAESLASLRGLVETQRRAEMDGHVARLVQLAVAYEAGAIRRDVFIDGTLAALLALRRESPGEAVPAAELLAAYADSHPIEPLPVPEGAGFIETIGRVPAVQSARAREPRPEDV